MSIRIEDLAKTDFRSVTVAGGKRIPPISPGEMLRDEFLKPMGLTNYRLAKEIDVPAQRIGDIIAGKRGITAFRFRGIVPDQTYTHFEDKPSFEQVDELANRYL